MNGHSLLIAMIVALLFSACARPTTVHFTIAAGSTATNLLLLREPTAERHAIRNFVIPRSGGRLGSTGQALWSFAAKAGNEVAVPESVLYGIAPVGFVAVPAFRLTPGRYLIDVRIGSRSVITYFRVAADGKVSL